jgi:carboxymethylenebutenolidase
MSESKNVQFAVPGGSETATGYIARPATGRPGVLVIQEWWGLVPHIKDVAGRFAELGYVTLAPDLYHGKTTVDAEEAAHLLHDLNWGLAARELAGAVRHLREVEGCTRVGVVGFCMGGALTVIAASQPGVDAYAAFYGFPPKGAVDLAKVQAPGLILFGSEEKHFSIPDAQAFATEQRSRGVPTDVVVYPGVQHAFFNDTRPEVFHREAANDAWRRTLALFGKALRPAHG